MNYVIIIFNRKFFQVRRLKRKKKSGTKRKEGKGEGGRKQGSIKKWDIIQRHISFI